MGNAAYKVHLSAGTYKLEKMVYWLRRRIMFPSGPVTCPGGKEKVRELNVTEESRTQVTFMSRGAPDPAESTDRTGHSEEDANRNC